MEFGADASFLKGKSAPPPLGQPDALTRWDPWVRGTIAVTELTRWLGYSDDKNDTMTVSYRPTGGSDVPLFAMTRPDRAFFEQQIPFVQSWAEIRDERAAEILAQIDNQFAFIAAVTGLNVGRKKWTMEWLMMVIQFTIEVELMFKHAFACYRPVDFSPQIQPLITTPGHGTYPMGHAAQSFATAVALAGLLGIDKTHPTYRQLMLQARRISVNRVVAGVHFPIDASAGEMLGRTLGETVLAACGLTGTTTPPCMSRSFAPAKSGDDPENNYLGDRTGLPLGAMELGTVTIAPRPYLVAMTALARGEWDV